MLVDLAAHEVRIGGKLVQLTSREYDLLVFLLRNPRQAFTREQLLSEVWGWTFGDTSTVTVHVRRLREKLEADPTLPRRIVTVWGVGYRYEPGPRDGGRRQTSCRTSRRRTSRTSRSGSPATAMLTTAIGVVGQRLLARRSIGLQVALVAMVTVVTALAAVGVISFRMLSIGDREVMLELMGIAGLAGLAVALVIGRSVTRATRRLLGAVREVGDSGIYTPPQVALPAELAGLSHGLAEAHDRLGRARAREQALEASRRELVAWVSHDLRTPLAGLRAMAEALEDQVVTDPREVSRYHSQIRVETDRLAGMIDDLFQLSKIHAGALRLSPRLVGLEDLIAEVAASTEPVARAKGVRLTGAAASGMAVHIDPAEFGRAVRNLVTNAIRHTPPDGTIEVLGEIQVGACLRVRGRRVRRHPAR